MEIRRWKAFLRLEGETLVEKDEDIMNEFKGFVQALKRVGIDYSIVVGVKEGKPERFAGRPKQATTNDPRCLVRKGAERVGG